MPKTLLALVLAFLVGALTGCGRIVEGCADLNTHTDTLWLFSATGDSLPAIITTEWCG
jgi:hypothetical protein